MDILQNESFREFIREEFKAIVNANSQPIRLLTPEEAAEMLGVKPGTLSAWRTNGNRGPDYTKIGDCVRYIYTDILSYIEKNKVKLR